MERSIWFIGFLSLVVGTGMAQADSGVAKVQGTALGSKIGGTINFQDTAGGLNVTGQLTGLPVGEHAFHIHEFGACDEMGKAAGSHYNPLNVKHGLVSKDGVMVAHAGDMGNIKADDQGNASINVLIPKVTLSQGPYTVGGRAVIVHEKLDDFSQPVGNAGSRIGCGLIIITSH